MKKFLVIGNPIEHSLSPEIHNFWLKKHKIDAVYEKKKIEEKDLPKIVSQIKNGEVDGVNITTPFKTAILPYINDTHDAYAAGVSILSLPKETYRGTSVEPKSINTLFKLDNFVLGANTDTHGFFDSLKIFHIDLKNKKAIVLGSGGVVYSVVFILKALGVSKIYLSNRTLSKAEEIKKIHTNNNNKSIIEIVEWENLEKNTPNADIIINATSLGLKKDDVIKINYEKFNKKIFYDIVYNKKENLPIVTDVFQGTTFLAMGIGNNNTAINGAAMLILQAARSFSIWHGFNPIEKKITNFNNTANHVFPDFNKENKGMSSD